MRKWSLEARQGRLQALVSRIDCLAVLVSDPSKTARHSRAAWVGRRREQAAIGALPLRRMSHWRKVKTVTSREANRECWHQPSAAETQAGMALASFPCLASWTLSTQILGCPRNRVNFSLALGTRSRSYLVAS
jgi:hypothetical protein